jgi:uncharacterized membrane protein YfcA
MSGDLAAAFVGLLTGFLVGLTGVGGGSLLTPLLIVVLGVRLVPAVTASLVTSVVVKTIGSLIHAQARTVRWDIVRRLALPALPAALLGSVVLSQLARGSFQLTLHRIIGLGLVVSAISLAAPLIMRRMRRETGVAPNPRRIAPRAWATGAVGAVVGFLVGLTSIGSGSLTVAALTVLYPGLASSEIVGTDLVAALILVLGAGTASIALNGFAPELWASLLIGSVPGVVIGAYLSSRVSDQVVRPLIAVALVISGVRLVTV